MARAASKLRSLLLIKRNKCWADQQNLLQNDTTHTRRNAKMHLPHNTNYKILRNCCSNSHPKRKAQPAATDLHWTHLHTNGYNIHRFSSSQQFGEVFLGRFEKKLLLIIVNHQTDMEIVVVKRTRFSHETRASSNDRANGTRQWFRQKEERRAKNWSR